MSPGIEWFLCHKKCEALYPTYTHTIESNIASSPVGTGRRWRLLALGGLI